MPRFSVRMLLIGVAAVAIGTVALVNASGTWARLIFAAAVAANIVSLIGAVVTRPGFVGFALAGWAYLLLSSSTILGRGRSGGAATRAICTVTDADRAAHAA